MCEWGEWKGIHVPNTDIRRRAKKLAGQPIDMGDSDVTPQVSQIDWIAHDKHHKSTIARCSARSHSRSQAAPAGKKAGFQH